MKAIENFIDAVMGAFPLTPETEELRMSLYGHMEDKFAALCADGLNEYEALGRVVAEFGSVEELRAELGFPLQRERADGDEDPELYNLLLDYNRFRPKFRAATAAAAVLFFLSLFSPAFSSEDFPAVTPYVLFFGCLALGAGLLIYFRGRARDYREQIRDRRAQLGLPQLPADGGAPFPGERGLNMRSRKRLIHILNATFPIWVVLIYLCMGSLFQLWHPGWLIFFSIPIYYVSANG